jgi:hypothetical protein
MTEQQLLPAPSRRLIDRLRETLGGYVLPAGALRRIQVLLGDEEESYATGDLMPQDDGSVTGVVIVLTPTRVVRAGVSALTTRRFDGPTGDVDVEAWPRSLLCKVSIPNSENDNEVWDDHLDRWPVGPRLLLSYGDGGRTITLPSSGYATPGNRRDLLALIPSLLDDLNK